MNILPDGVIRAQGSLPLDCVELQHDPFLIQSVSERSWSSTSVGLDVIQDETDIFFNSALLATAAGSLPAWWWEEGRSDEASFRSRDPWESWQRGG